MTSVFSADSIESPGFKSSAAGVEVAAIKQGDIPTRQLAQEVYVTVSAMTTSTASIPYDNSVPEITEGFQVLSASIIPKSATSILQIDVILNASPAAAQSIIAAIFKAGITNALTASLVYQSAATGVNQICLTARIISGNTSSQTFSVRAGGHAGTTMTYNGSSSQAFLGGVLTSSISIKEYLP